jgi:hypothetical protein
MSRNGFQRRNSISFRVSRLHVLAGRRLSVSTVSQQPQTRIGLSACLRDLSRLSTRSDWLAFRFFRRSFCTDATENTVPLLMWVTWSQVFYCSGTVRLAPPLPTALLLLRDAITVGDVTCSTVVCVFVRLMSCLLCRNVVTTLSQVLVSQ